VSACGEVAEKEEKKRRTRENLIGVAFNGRCLNQPGDILAHP
jgi:hypothetical protein